MRQSQSAHWRIDVKVGLWLILSGAMQALSMAWPFQGGPAGNSQGWLQCVSFVVFAWHLSRSQSARQAVTKAWLFSFVWLLGCIWWLFISMHRYGGLAAPLAAIAVALLAAGLALIYAMAGGIYFYICHPSLGALAHATAFAATWTLAELVRGTLWTGFPWGAIGYAHVDSVLRHWASWVGVYGICAIAAFIAMALAHQGRRKRTTTRETQMAIILVALAMAYAGWISPSRDGQAPNTSAQPLHVTLLQGNIAQDLKFGEGVNLALQSYRDGLLSSVSDLTVTPETAIPLIQQQMPERYWRELEAHFSKGQQAALVGLPAAVRSEQGQLLYSNSAVALMPQQTSTATASYKYDKQHLVPFGEFVPPFFQWFVRMMNIPLGDFTRGDVAQPSLLFKGERIAPNICYEDLFGEELAQSFSRAGQEPTILVNLSNIAWFGDTVAIDQHLNISRMRALELNRPMLRATNTGATAIINAQGVVTHRLPSGIQGALTAEVYGVHGPATPYAQWVSVLGLWPLAGLAVFLLLFIARMSYGARHGQRRFGP